ncbi:MAG: hypothetical protein KAS32_22150, partial [Candidatus Peribacteraceae bacterium]|nr:hypothetical protein [Candidatus Peribacteraceae bacterium]
IDERYLEIEGYDSAVWLKQNDVWVIVGSSQVVLRISAISDVSHFPGQGSTQLVYDFAYPSDMVLETRSLFDIKFYTDSPIIDTERIDEWIIWGNYDINRRPIEDIRVQRYINQFNIETLVINNYDDTHSVFTDSVMQTSYCTFNNQKVKCFYI